MPATELKSLSDLGGGKDAAPVSTTPVRSNCPARGLFQLFSIYPYNDVDVVASAFEIRL